MALRAGVAVTAAALLMGQAAAFSVQLGEPVKVPRSKGAAFRMPRGGVGFGQARAVLKLHTKVEGCRCAADAGAGSGEDGAKPPCSKACGAKEEEFVYTVDSGARFYSYKGERRFCGAKSVEAEEEGETVRHCPHEEAAEPAEDAIHLPVVEWSLTAGGLVSSPELKAKERADKKFTVWTTGIKRGTPSAIRFGDNILDMKDKKLMFRLAEVDYSEEERHSVLLKSQDEGYTWFYLGSLPTSIGEQNSLERIGENDLQVFIRSENRTVLRTMSKTLGRKWSNVTADPTYLTIPRVTPARFTSHVAGGRVGPTLMSIGAKKGTEQVHDLAQHHNEHMDDSDDFHEGFLKHMRAALNETKASQEQCANPPFPADPERCASTGHVDAVSLGHPEGDANSTDLLLCYDHLKGGHDSASEEDDVYCVRARVNETEEARAAEEKLRKKMEREKAKEEYQKKLEERAREERERKRQKKRDKQKKVRQQRLQWAKIDEEENVAPAREFMKEDGELVIVREVGGRNEEYAAVMDESLGVPEQLDGDQGAKGDGDDEAEKPSDSE